MESHRQILGRDPDQFCRFLDGDGAHFPNLERLSQMGWHFT